MKYIIHAISLLSLFVSACAQNDEVDVDLSSLYFIGENEGRSDIMDCFHKIISRDFSAVYEFGSDSFKRKIRKEDFIAKLDQSPRLRFIRTESIVIHGDTGFYFTVNYSEPGYGKKGRRALFFWKFIDGSVQFVHFPLFGIPDTLDLTPLFREN